MCTDAPHIPKIAISEVAIHNVACQTWVEVNGDFVVLHEVAQDGPIIQNWSETKGLRKLRF